MRLPRHSTHSLRMLTETGADGVLWDVGGVGVGRGILSEASVVRSIIHCTVAPRPVHVMSSYSLLYICVPYICTSVYWDICVHGGVLRAIAHTVAGREVVC